MNAAENERRGLPMRNSFSAEIEFMENISSATPGDTFTGTDGNVSADFSPPLTHLDPMRPTAEDYEELQNATWMSLLSGKNQRDRGQKRRNSKPVRRDSCLLPSPCGEVGGQS